MDTADDPGLLSPPFLQATPDGAQASSTPASAAGGAAAAGGGVSQGELVVDVDLQSLAPGTKAAPRPKPRPHARASPFPLAKFQSEPSYVLVLLMACESCMPYLGPTTPAQF